MNEKNGEEMTTAIMERMKKNTVVVARQGTVIFGKASGKFLLGISQTGSVKEVDAADIVKGIKRTGFDKIHLDTQKPMTGKPFIMGTSKTNSLMTVDTAKLFEE